MKSTVAFDVCQEIYAAARELVDARLPTMQLDSVSKYLWRPDRRPRLVEYVADFALAGERELTETLGRTGAVQSNTGGCVAPRLSPCADCCAGAAARAGGYASRVRVRGQDAKSAACRSCGMSCAAAGTLLASRLVLFRMYYLGSAEYEATRRMLGISELTWCAWTDEIRGRVGGELLRSGLFPPARYFRQPTRK